MGEIGGRVEARRFGGQLGHIGISIDRATRRQRGRNMAKERTKIRMQRMMLRVCVVGLVTSVGVLLLVLLLLLWLLLLWLSRCCVRVCCCCCLALCVVVSLFVILPPLIFLSPCLASTPVARPLV